MKPLFYCIVAVLLLSLASCTGYSKYPVMRTPNLKVDNSLLGIWKTDKDSIKEDFILIQSWSKTHEALIAHYGSYENYIKNGSMDSMYSIWESNNRNKLYFITRFNLHGKNPLHQQVTSFVSEISGERFFNIQYHDGIVGGFFFVRILSASSDTIEVSVISDPSMKELASSAAVREKIEKNINNRNFYKDTVRFYKVKGGDIDINNAIELAN